jgi:hypothetical protein
MLIQPMSQPLPAGDGVSLAPGKPALTALRDGLLRLLALEVGPATVATLLGVRPGEARAWLASLGFGTPVPVSHLMAHLPPLETDAAAPEPSEKPSASVRPRRPTC